MIAKSDVVILVVSASLLAAGIYRWQSNLPRSVARHTVAAASGGNQSGNRQGTGSLSAKPDSVAANLSTDVTRGAAIDAPVTNNFGNTGQTDALQSSTQSAAIAAENGTGQAGSSSNAAGQPLYGTYEVQSGDTLSRIASIYGTTIDSLRTINGISGSLITVGQNILYPLPAN